MGGSIATNKRPKFARGTRRAPLSERQALLLVALVQRGGVGERIPWAAKQLAPGMSRQAAGDTLAHLERRGCLTRCKSAGGRTTAVMLTELGHREGARRARHWQAVLSCDKGQRTA